MMSRKIKIFIAYAHKDKQAIEEFRTHAMPLVRSQQLEIWFDGEIRPGEVWNDSIKNNLHSADIILLLLSANALASDYFYTQEVEDALERHRKNNTRVVPILLSHCLWEETPLSTLQGLPTGMKPIYEWRNFDAAWNNVVQGIRAIIQELGARSVDQRSAMDTPNPEQSSTKGLKQPSEAELHAWEFTQDMNKKSGYEKYLNRFPDGFHAEEAKAKLDTFLAEEIAWEFTLEAKTEKAFQKYLDKYPGGMYAGLALAELEKLRPPKAKAPTPAPSSYKNKKSKANRCSFCGRTEEEVMILVSGMEAQICEYCSAKAAEIIDKELRNAGVDPAKI